MIERLEGTFWGYQDVELYYQLWKSIPIGVETSTTVEKTVEKTADKTVPNNGTLIVTHGAAEHSDCYQRFAEEMAPKGWTVFVWDLRGHGRSEGKRGYVNRFQDFSNDLDAKVDP